MLAKREDGTVRFDKISDPELSAIQREHRGTVMSLPNEGPGDKPVSTWMDLTTSQRIRQVCVHYDLPISLLLREMLLPQMDYILEFATALKKRRDEQHEIDRLESERKAAEKLEAERRAKMTREELLQEQVQELRESNVRYSQDIKERDNRLEELEDRVRRLVAQLGGEPF